MANPFARRFALSNLLADPAALIDERIDAKLRQPQPADWGPGGYLGAGMPAPGSGSGTGEDPELVSAATQRVLKLSVADNGSGYLDLGAASGISTVWARYTIVRNTTTPIREAGKFELLHDGSSAWVAGRQGSPVPPGSGLAGVTFSASIAGGQLRLTAAASNLTPDASADIGFIFTLLEVLF